MGFYQEQFLPRVQDKVMDRAPMREIRRRICAGLHGDVVEIGFGTGLNAPYYPEEVSVVRAVEPSKVCMHLAESRIARSTTTVEPSGLNGEKLDLSSEQFDAVLSTWTLCTIPDVEAALEQMLRVLKPGGAFHFVEHGRAPDAKTARWQDRLEPLNKRLAGGCHLTRNIPDLIENAGFSISSIDTYYVEREPKPFAYTFEGRAAKA